MLNLTADTESMKYKFEKRNHFREGHKLCLKETITLG